MCRLGVVFFFFCYTSNRKTLDLTKGQNNVLRCMRWIFWPLIHLLVENRKEQKSEKKRGLACRLQYQRGEAVWRPLSSAELSRSNNVIKGYNDGFYHSWNSFTHTVWLLEPSALEPRTFLITLFNSWVTEKKKKKKPHTVARIVKATSPEYVKYTTISFLYFKSLLVTYVWWHFQLQVVGTVASECSSQF